MRVFSVAAIALGILCTITANRPAQAQASQNNCANINELTKTIVLGQKKRGRPAALAASQFLQKAAKAQSAKKQYVLCNDSVATGLRILKWASPIADASEPVKPAKPGSGHKWLGSFRFVPDGTISTGLENGNRLFICRAKHAAKTHPGKVVNKRCNVTYGGKGIFKTKFDLLTGNQKKITWVKGKPRNVKLFCAGDFVLCCDLRVRRPGKLVISKCNVGWRSKESSEHQYLVATLGGIPCTQT